LRTSKINSMEILGRNILPDYSGASIDLYCVTFEVFLEICSFWEDLSLDRLLVLKNLFIIDDPVGGFFVKVWVAPIGGGQILCLKTRFPHGAKLPNLSQIWPKLHIIEQQSYFEAQAQDSFLKRGVAWVNS